jgi:7-cyano-7-deazaguanine synthase in queuosine biosynthesis
VSPAVTQTLIDTLSFLSEDDFAFDFAPLEVAPRAATYLDLGPSAGFVPSDVILFSGGLDSLAGAVEALAAQNRKVALVSHRSVAKVASAQRALVQDLRGKFGARRVMHIPVWMNLMGRLNQESTHRTRSFLFTALAAVTARLCGLDRFSFYENGIVSLNLPPVAQVVGSRATRSTHPQALAGFRRLLSAVVSRPFEVDNPFAWLTKTQVVERIAAHGGADLIRHSRSCTRVRDRTKQYPHCGRCSQCIDRRFAVLAEGQADSDPAEAYEVDLFAGARPEGPDREMALAYVRMASEIETIDEQAFFASYGEVSRIIRYFSEPADVVAGRVLDLYRRHASAVGRVSDGAIESHASALRVQTLPPDCLLSLVIGRQIAPLHYAQPALLTEPAPTPGPQRRIAIGGDGKTVTVNGWGDLDGADAELIIALAGPFEQAVNEKRAPENYPFLKWQALGPLLNVDGDELVRQRVTRCRETIEHLAVDFR